jgi:hypothetical protein
MNEQWEPVPGYEGLYDVSDRGRVRSLDHRRHGQLWRGRIRKLSPDRKVQLSKEGRVRYFAVSTLMKLAFPHMRAAANTAAFVDLVGARLSA